MSNIPDYVLQVQEVERQIEAQSAATAEDWKDAVQERYYTNFMDAYREKIELYIYGGMGMTGKGLNDLLVFLDKKMQEMEAVSGVPADLTFMCATGSSYIGTMRDNYGGHIDVEETEEVQRRDGIVHNDRRERDYWQDQETYISRYNGPRPGEYSNEELQKLMELRQQDDFGKDMNASLK